MPDIICGHPGWGELLFLKDVWPESPILSYQEFFYNPKGFDYDFDKEFQEARSWEDCAQIRIKTANQLLNLEASEWCVTPTHFQRSSFPDSWQKKISIIHDGIDTVHASPSKNPEPAMLPCGKRLLPGEKLVTFVNRTLEPYRGCHTMLRALPDLQALQNEAHVLIVGETSGVSYGAQSTNGEWKDIFLAEIKDKYDPSKVTFCGTLDYSSFLSVLKLSQVHVYLTYPFVVSWSLLEAMSTGCPIVASATQPVQEIITHEKNGLLVDFFKPYDLACAISELLDNRKLASKIGLKGRETILQRYELKKCVQEQLNLINLVASGAISQGSPYLMPKTIYQTPGNIQAYNPNDDHPSIIKLWAILSPSTVSQSRRKDAY